MKINKYIGMTMMVAGVLAATSCTDFDDYNKAATDVTASANQTLWENIQQTPELSDFAALVQRAGFADELNATQCYTVWAPKNGTFNPQDYAGLTNEALLKQFVKNHVASYSFPATGELEERILMLNEKTYNFVGNSGYTFDGINLSGGSYNLPSTNGVLHIMDGAAVYYPNLYEYVTDSVLAAGKNIKTLQDFFRKYETTYLDESRSVVGPIVDGLQTYVDSVMVTENSLWSTLNARLAVEDSSYTFLMPTDKAWKGFYDRIAPYYNYQPTTLAQAFETNARGVTSISKTNATRSVNRVYWQDSMTSRFLTRYLIYSNNSGYNQWMVGEPSSLGTDTLYTTTRTKLTSPEVILAQTTSEVPMSNGRALIVDSLAMHSWETFSPIIEAPANRYRARVDQGSASAVQVVSTDPNQPNYSYVYVQPGSEFDVPELDITLPNVMSTTYSLYCVFVPPFDRWANDPAYVAKPNRVIFTLNYCNDKGALADQEFIDENQEHIDAFQAIFNLRDNRTNRTTIRSFQNDPMKLDTLYIGDFTFPACYYGLGDEICPNIKITCPLDPFDDKLMNAFTRELRIAGIVMKPKELVEFEESNKE